LAFWDGKQWLRLGGSAPPKPKRSAADWVATLMMLGTVVALAVVTATRATVPLLSFDPQSAPFGTKVAVTAYGLPALTTVQLDWDGSTAGMPPARTSNRGVLAVRFQVPTASPGSHTVNVRATGQPGRKKGAILAGTLVATGVFVLSTAATPAPSSSDSPTESGASTTPTNTPSPSAADPTPTSAPPSPSSATPTPSLAPPATQSPTPSPGSSGPSPTPGPQSSGPSPTAAPTQSGSAWLVVIDDQFDSGGVPSHWGLYDGQYNYGPHNCATPSHVSVSGGSMHLLMRYETSGKCGSGWYTAGMYAKGADSVDQRVTVRFRVVSNGAVAHRIIPMRWPSGGTWPQDGEEDYCEGSALTGCSTYLHYATSNLQLSHTYSVDLTQWHTIRFERLNLIVRTYIDDMSTPVWTYLGTSVTLPETLKHVVLQQECKATGCPAGTIGSEDIQIDWITIAVPTG
jgi:hypothetical protein